MKKYRLLILLGLCFFVAGCSAKVNFSDSNIRVLAGTSYVPNGDGFYDFGSVLVGNAPETVVFTIENDGPDSLLLTRQSKIIVIGNNSEDFKFDTSFTKSELEAGAHTFFSIIFNPQSIGQKSVTIKIYNTDADNNPYIFKVLGLGLSKTPEINIKQGMTDILSSTGKYDFGGVKVYESSSAVEFTIYNYGEETLQLTGNPSKISIGGNDPGEFNIEQSNVPNEIPSGQKAVFKISFAPQSAGVKTAKISVLNNDSDENPYTFTVQGTGLAGPEINVKIGADNIVSGNWSYDLGNIRFGEESTVVNVIIENLGAIKLQLTGSPDVISISGADATSFIINQTNTKKDINPGESTSFSMVFKPSSLGAKSATLSIASTDDDEDPFTFDIEGAGVTPEIHVKQGLVSIVNGTSFDFGGVKISGSGLELEFTVENEGTGDLKLSGSPIVEISGPNASLFSIDTNSTLTTITPSNNTSFKVKCIPVTMGVKTATISIANDDDDENPYTFTITATGTVYTEGDLNGDGLADMVVGSCYNDGGGGSSGRVYIFFGKSNWNSSYDASNADVKISGEDAGDEFGFSISMAGDVNDDGFEDIVVGAHDDDDGGTHSGCAFIFFGRYNWKSSVDASEANVKLIGADADDEFGYAVTCGGDINNDGIKDVVVGAYLDDDGGTNSGCAFIFFGRTQWASPIDASNANVKLIGENANDWFGVGGSIAGDVNNDGIQDLIVGAYGNDEGASKAGSAYIFFGRSVWASSVDASNANVKLIGEDADDMFGRYISSSGDINNDGVDDIVIAADYDDDGGSSSGCVFIFFGRSNWASKIDASIASVKLIGENSGDNFGRGVCIGEDVNNDGHHDLIIGALKADDGGNASGVSYLFFGSSNWNTTTDASLADVKLIGEKELDFFGRESFICMDINNDGLNDVVIGAYGDDVGGNMAGAAYIFYGRSNWVTSIDASLANVKIIGEDADDRFGSFLLGK